MLMRIQSGALSLIPVPIVFIAVCCLRLEVTTVTLKSGSLVLARQKRIPAHTNYDMAIQLKPCVIFLRAHYLFQEEVLK